MMWQTTMNPETRRLIQVVPDDIKKTEEFFDLFLGDNLPGRNPISRNMDTNILT